MATSKFSRGLTVPGFWQCVVASAALFMGWALWNEFGGQPRGPGLQSRISDEHREAFESPIASLRAVEAFARYAEDPVPRLMAELSSANPRSRALALHGLATIGPGAFEALDAIGSRLSDENPQVRAQALAALWPIGRDAEAAGRVVAEMLADPDSEVRDTAVRQLLIIGPATTKLVLARLEDNRMVVREQALRVLRGWPRHRFEDWAEWLGDVRAPVRKLLNDSDPGLRTEALTAIVAWGLADADEVRELLHHPDYARVDVALQIIPNMGRDAGELVPDVVDLIGRLEVETVRAGHRSAMPLILRALKTLQTTKARPAYPRFYAVRRQLVHVLGALILDEDRDVAYHAGRLLVEVSPMEARARARWLLPRLGNGQSVDKSVLYALYALAPEARDAGPKVTPLVRHSDPWVSRFARHVLHEMRPDPLQASSGAS